MSNEICSGKKGREAPGLFSPEERSSRGCIRTVPALVNINTPYLRRVYLFRHTQQGRRRVAGRSVRVSRRRDPRRAVPGGEDVGGPRQCTAGRARPDYLRPALRRLPRREPRRAAELGEASSERAHARPAPRRLRAHLAPSRTDFVRHHETWLGPRQIRSAEV